MCLLELPPMNGPNGVRAGPDGSARRDEGAVASGGLRLELGLGPLGERLEVQLGTAPRRRDFSGRRTTTCTSSSMIWMPSSQTSGLTSGAPCAWSYAATC